MILIKHILTVIKSTRPPFLVLSPVCIFLGYSSAILSGSDPEQYLIITVFVGALCAHISVNTFNEYLDFKSGLDNITEKTPFSGGSGALPEDPQMAASVLAVAIVCIIITLILGIYFIYLRGMSLLLLLTVGVSIILAYTRWLNKYPFLCLIAPGLSFGPLFVVGSHVVLAGSYDLTNFYVSLVPFLLISNLLLLNQYPDIEADQSIGRNHFPIAYGIKKSNLVYIGMTSLAAVIVIFGVSTSLLPETCLFCLLPMLVVIPVIYGITKYADDTQKLIPYLGMNVFVALSTPLTLGISILIY
ncbi:MAG: prenyltransferase [Gammaproteobacteria bacterium]|jgi:1,4-dihydroxy-2-naphthoate polyprenyltransferase|nr:prenyltransferase [Gammaproteobacteria bacterium]